MRLDTDPYRQHYADRVGGLSASAIRALFAVASRPEVVSFAGGMPATDQLDFDAVTEVVAGVLADDGPTALQYGIGQGRPELREQLVEVMEHEGVPGHVDDLLVTAGGQQGLELTAKCLVNPGDIVLAEGPSYVGGLGALSSHRADVRHVPMDADGMQVEVLADRLDELAREGRRAKVVYTIPNHQNPAGVSLSLPRRHRLVELAHEHDLIILEDNPYGLIDFDGVTRTSLRELAPDRVVYVSTMSKTFAPGVRTGWVAAPAPIRDKLVLLREAADLCPANFTQMVVERWLATQPWQDQIARFRQTYRERATTMLDALSSHMPAGMEWNAPRGGLFVWVSVGAGIDTSALLAKAVQRRVAYVPGDGFFADGSGHTHLRLNFSYPPPERIQEGVERLASVITEERELARAVYGDHPVTPPAAAPDDRAAGGRDQSPGTDATSPRRNRASAPVPPVPASEPTPEATPDPSTPDPSTPGSPTPGTAPAAADAAMTEAPR